MLDGTRSPPDLCRVYIRDFIEKPMVTEALHNPHMRLSMTNSNTLDLFSMKSTKMDNSLEGRRVMVLRRVVDRFKIFWILISILVISPCMGVLVGLCSKDANVGIAVSAGVFALATFLQGLAVWVQG